MGSHAALKTMRVDAILTHWNIIPRWWWWIHVKCTWCILTHQTEKISSKRRIIVYIVYMMTTIRMAAIMNSNIFECWLHEKNLNYCLCANEMVLANMGLWTRQSNNNWKYNFGKAKDGETVWTFGVIWMQIPHIAANKILVTDWAFYRR